MNEPNEARGNAHFLTSVHSLSWKVPWQQPGLPTPCDLLCVTSPNPTENRYFYLQTCKCQSVKSFWSLEKMTQTSIKRRFCSSASYITDLKPTDGHFTVYYLKVWWEHLKKQNITTVLFKWLHTHIFFLCLRTDASSQRNSVLSEHQKNQTTRNDVIPMMLEKCFGVVTFLSSFAFFFHHRSEWKTED